MFVWFMGRFWRFCVKRSWNWFVRVVFWKGSVGIIRLFLRRRWVGLLIGFIRILRNSL